MLLPLLLLCAGVAQAPFVPYADKYCSGGGPTACDNPADPPPGASQYGPNYGYMGDVGLEECQAKAGEMQSPCFDYSPKGNGRAGEKCRICKAGQAFRPLHESKSEYTAYIYVSSWGWSVVAVILAPALAYFGLGMLYTSRTKGVPLGWAALPHAALWQEVASLAKDGAAFARGGSGGRQGRGYAKVGAGQGEKHATHVERRQEGRGGKRGGKEEKSGGKKARKTKKEQRSEPGPAPRPAPAAASAAPAAAAGTAAGDGGRWVHVPG